MPNPSPETRSALLSALLNRISPEKLFRCRDARDLSPNYQIMPLRPQRKGPLQQTVSIPKLGDRRHGRFAVSIEEIAAHESPIPRGMTDVAIAFREFSVSAMEASEALENLMQPFGERFPNHLPSCRACMYWSGTSKLPCAVNPLEINDAGGDSLACRDFESL